MIYWVYSFIYWFCFISLCYALGVLLLCDIQGSWYQSQMTSFILFFIPMFSFISYYNLDYIQNLDNTFLDYSMNFCTCTQKTLSIILASQILGLTSSAELHAPFVALQQDLLITYVSPSKEIYSYNETIRIFELLNCLNCILTNLTRVAIKKSENSNKYPLRYSSRPFKWCITHVYKTMWVFMI